MHVCVFLLFSFLYFCFLLLCLHRDILSMPTSRKKRLAVQNENLEEVKEEEVVHNETDNEDVGDVVDGTQLSEEEVALLGDPATIIPLGSKEAVRALVQQVAPWLRVQPIIMSAERRKEMVFAEYMMKMISMAWNLVKAELRAADTEDVDPLGIMTALLHGTDDVLAKVFIDALDTKFNGEDMELEQNTLYSTAEDWHPTPADYALMQQSGLMRHRIMVSLCAAVDRDATRRTRHVRALAHAKQSLLHDTREQKGLGLLEMPVDDQSWLSRAQCLPPLDASLEHLAKQMAGNSLLLRQLLTATKRFQQLLAPTRVTTGGKHQLALKSADPLAKGVSKRVHAHSMVT
jgi:hypothetical protein